MRENMPLNSSGEGSKRYHKSFPKACNGGFFHNSQWLNLFQWFPVLCQCYQGL